MLETIDIRLKDTNGRVRKDLETLKIELNLSTNKDVIHFLIKHYKNTLKNTPVYESRNIYDITYTDGSKTTMLLTQKELIDFKKSKHYSQFTNDDIMVKDAVKIY